MLCVPCPGECFRNLCFILSATVVRKPANLCGSRSPLTIARMIACPVAPVTSLKLVRVGYSLQQRLLHMQHMRRSMLDQLRTMT